MIAGGAVDVTNGSRTNTTARIDGYVGAGGSGSVTNFATITGGIYAGAGGATNGASASTAALILGVTGIRSAGDISNFGTIRGTSQGANGNGAITNGISGQTIGTIIGGGFGVSGSGTLLNYGLVGATGPSGSGVSLSGAVTNGAPVRRAPGFTVIPLACNERPPAGWLQRA